MLDQFGHDLLAGYQVHHAKRVEPDQRSSESIRQRRKAVHDDHRRIVESGLHRGRARGGQRQIGGGEHAVGVAGDRRDRRSRDGAKQIVVEILRTGDHELHLRDAAPDQDSRAHEIRQDP